MKVFTYFFVLQFLLAFPCGAHSSATVGDGEHASVDVIVGSVSENEVEAAISFRIQDGWHIYAADPGDTGIATSVSFKDSEVLWHDIHWPKHEVDILKVGKKVFKSNVYTSFVALPLVVKFKDHTKKIHMELQFAVCGDTCIPNRKTLVLDVSNHKLVNEEHVALIKKWRGM